MSGRSYFDGCESRLCRRFGVRVRPVWTLSRHWTTRSNRRHSAGSRPLKMDGNLLGHTSVLSSRFSKAGPDVPRNYGMLINYSSSVVPMSSPVSWRPLLRSTPAPSLASMTVFPLPRCVLRCPQLHNAFTLVCFQGCAVERLFRPGWRRLGKQDPVINCL